MYCLFYDVLCIVCVYMCTELLPPGGYPNAVKYIISYIIDNRAVYETMWKKLKSGHVTDNNTIRRICFTCWITTDYKHKLQTNTFIIFNNAFRRQQWLHERASMLRYT
jgi:hypothetical protein